MIQLLLKRVRLCCLGIAGFLSACASIADLPSLENTQQAYDQHISQFAIANPHKRHVLNRPDGHKLAAREFGSQHKDNGTTYILMHGFPDNQHLYDSLIPLLARTAHVISFDFLGWGESDKPAAHNYKVTTQRTDLDTVISALKITSAVIVTHDLSGQVGIDWALDNPTQVNELVLLNSYYNAMPTLIAPDAIEFYSKPGVLRDLARFGANKSAARFKSGLANQLYAFMSNPAARLQFIPILAHSAPDIRPAFFSAVDALWGEIDARANQNDRMKAFIKPVRIIFGRDDPFLNAGVAESFAKTFSNRCIQLISGANHYVQLDQATLVAQSMLSKHAGAGACKPN